MSLFPKAALAAFLLSLTLGFASLAPVASSASVMLVKSPHLCRDNKTGKFIKGKYLKCPAGSHKA
jgi:hypothetical protein